MSSYLDRRLEAQRRAEEARQKNAPPQQSPQAQTEVEKTFGGFMRNLGSDAMDFAVGITAPLHSTNEFTKGISDLMYNDQGEYTTDGLKQMGGQIVDRAKEIISNPADAFYERPLSTGLDVVGAAVPPLRGAQVVAGARGANAVSDGIGKVANAVENLDPMSWPATGAAIANRAGTQIGALDDSVRRTEGVIKPKLSERHKQSDPAYRSTVINGALERGIDPTEKGMSNLQDQQAKVYAEMDKVMNEVGDRQINTTDLVNGWEEYAMRHIDRSNVDWEDMVKGVKAKTGKLQRQYKDHPEGEILSINSKGLRKARQSADGKVNHNARNQEGDSVAAELDRLYSHYLREQLGNAVPEMKHLTEEASALFDIYDMYNPAVVRMSNHNPVSLPVTNAMAGTGIASAIVGGASGNPSLGIAGTALAAAPLIANAKPTRIMQARSNHETGKAGLGDPITGGLLRDRNGNWSTGRKGANYIENLFSSVMGEEEER